MEILRKCRKDTTLVELMTLAGRTDRTKFRHQVLNPLIAQGLIEMTVPNKPRSRFQKYRLAEKGLAWLAEFRRHDTDEPSAEATTQRRHGAATRRNRGPRK